MKYAAARVLHGIVLLIGVSLLSFAFAQLAPGDYFSEMRIDPSVSTETDDDWPARVSGHEQYAIYR